METPYTNHLTASDFNHVYEPAEDSFLLIDALESELKYLRDRSPLVALEIGPGSGVVITAVSKALMSITACIGVDINAFACRATRKTARHNGADVDVINGDLLQAIRPHSIDILIFNPPYVLTPDDEIPHGNNSVDVTDSADFNTNIVKSWAGGTDGRIIINKLFSQLDESLAIDGVLYLLVIKDNDPKKIIEDLKTLKFCAVIIAERKIRGEHLFVLKISRFL